MIFSKSVATLAILNAKYAKDQVLRRELYQNGRNSVDK